MSDNIEFDEIPYIRVGTDYYKIINRPLISGDSLRSIMPWTKTTIKEDHGNTYIRAIKKYDGFCCMPNHLHYQPVVKGFYNEYREFKWTDPVQGDLTNTQKFIKHIFGEQYHIGLDYLKILLEKPTKSLPILCLVSQERNTGKTTFLNWLKEIFDANMTINTNQDFESRFNTDWTGKLIIAIDEAFFDKKETSERLKNLSTTRNFKAEAKNKDKKEVEFFGKFILCSNNEDSFIKIDDDEIRYWVRKISPLDSDDVHLLQKLKEEIPAFIHFLINYQMATKEVTRMWFTKEQIHTEALERVVKKNKSFIHQELAYIIQEKLDEFQLDEISFSISDLYELIKQSSLRCTKVQISEILNDKWGMKSENTTYYSYSWSSINGDPMIAQTTPRKGRCFTFLKSTFQADEFLSVQTDAKKPVDFVDSITN